jgi:hypothetical protein
MRSSANGVLFSVSAEFMGSCFIVFPFAGLAILLKTVGSASAFVKFVGWLNYATF